MKKLNLAIIGQGRSGRNIHGKFLKTDKNEFFNVKYVVEADEFRRNRAASEYEGCTTFADYTELFGIKDIDLVVNATYSDMHYAITKDLLKHGFNVLSEKPLCRNVYECDDLIKTAEENKVIVAAFQQTFGAPYYQFTKNLIASGKLGEVQQISIRFNNFARRWDWQTLIKRMAGNAFNTGPHPIGMAYGFLDFDKDAKVVYCKANHTSMSSGDADDYVKMIFEAPNKPIIDLEINNTDGFSDYNIKIQGSKGCFKTTPASYKMKYIVDGENEERKVSDTFLEDENKNPVYCRDNLKVHEEEGTFEGSAFDVGTMTVYKSLYYAITEGKPLFVTMEQARMTVSATEQLHAKNPLPRKF